MEGFVAMTTENPAARMGRFVRMRRKQLKLTQAAVQEAGGPSPATQRVIEAGKHADMRDGTVEALERVLRWEPGSIEATLAGGSPIYEIHIDDEIRGKLGVRSGKLTSGGMPESNIRAEEHGAPPIPATGSATRLGRYLETKKIPVAERSTEQHLFMSEYEGELRRRAQGAERVTREEPLVDLVDEGQALAARKSDQEVSDYVRRVESAVVGIMGVHRLTDALDGRAQERTIVRANKAGVLDQLVDEVDRLRVAGITGRELQRRVEGWLDAMLSSDDSEPDLEAGLGRAFGADEVEDRDHGGEHAG